MWIVFKSWSLRRRQEDGIIAPACAETMRPLVLKAGVQQAMSCCVLAAVLEHLDSCVDLAHYMAVALLLY